MLGRTAASLFWMSRYVERAENIARLTEVGYRISLTPDTGSGHREDCGRLSGCLFGTSPQNHRGQCAAFPAV